MDKRPESIAVPEGSELELTGIAVSPGIAIGPAYVYARETYEVKRRPLDESEIEAEVERYEKAVARSERDLIKIIAITREKVGEESAAIFDAQRLMLYDDSVRSEILAAIRKERVNASYAVHRAITHHRRLLEAAESEYLRERATDLADLENRIIRHLRRGKLISSIDPSQIVVAETLTAADIILFSRRGTLGCAMDYGGPTSHVSILARSLGVPAIVSAHGASGAVQTGQTVILDGIQGRLIANPSAQTLERYTTRRKRYVRLQQEEKHLVPLASETIDGHPVSLQANLELRDELHLLSEYGAEGIGLFRTEILFLMEGRLSVTEEGQLRTYRQAVEAASPHTTTFRVLDLGGDKLLPMAHREHNPFLGWRGVRVLLDRPELLMPQLRALLRASAFGPIRILIPMVTDVTEMRRVRQHVEQAKDELRAEGHAFDEDVPLGAMIEVPSAALLADRIAAESDFFSIGSNDLTQYALAVDRGNDMVAPLYRDLHPAVLQLVKSAVDAAKRRGISVSLCGELANNLRAVPVLIGLGLDALSMAPVYLPRVKRVIRAMRLDEGRELAEAALRAEHADDLTERLDRWLDEHACGVQFFLEGNGGVA